MKSLKHGLRLLPAWILTGITTLGILWLTLAPKPLGNEEIELFPGADKVAHALMFGFLTLTVLVDLARGRSFAKVKPWETLLSAVIVTLFGALIEVLQRAMALGRTFDWFDILADGTGAFLVAIIWIVGVKVNR